MVGEAKRRSLNGKLFDRPLFAVRLKLALAKLVALDVTLLARYGASV